MLPDGVRVADPASRCQARDAVGPSLVIDPSAYHWQHQDWRGRPWREAVIYELHIGSFTPGGTFAGAIERLPYLSQLGVTAIELMPLADFPGRRNWGYDGVLPFAPDRSYGTPDELKALVDAAHGHGLMVFLDVVYNHFGPAGNRLGRYAPEFFTADIRTPWGEAIDFRRPEVRAFYIANALYWLEEFRFDGLRFDAVHAIVDPSETHFLVELARTVRTDRRAARFILCSRTITTVPPSCGTLPNWAGGCSTRSGTTTCITPCTSCSPASGTATMPTSPTRPSSGCGARWPRASSIRASRPPIAAESRAASLRATSRL